MRALRVASIVSAVLLMVTLGLDGLAAATAATATTSPSPRNSAGVVYDVARSQVVLFGGTDDTGYYGDTWTWDGAHWTQAHPATSPPNRAQMGIAYDAARGQVVVFGGDSWGAMLNDTWTWDGTTWTEQHPTNSPPARYSMAMAYDAAREEVVLFSGVPAGADTWTWNGTTWTQEHPAVSPPDRWAAGFAYDAASGNVVLFGGNNGSGGGLLDDTWIWNGTNWKKQRPATRPPGRLWFAMASDATHGTVVLYGGWVEESGQTLGDTWTWDGANWTKEQPANAPSKRSFSAMADDPARGQVVLFGGYRYGACGQGYFGDTWAWNGTTWRVPIVAHLGLTPKSGPAGSLVTVSGTGFAACERTKVTFIDSVNGKSLLGTLATGPSGNLKAQVSIPTDATPGRQKINLLGSISSQKAKATFTVT